MRFGEGRVIDPTRNFTIAGALAAALSACAALPMGCASHFAAPPPRAGTLAFDARLAADSGSFPMPFFSDGRVRTIRVWYHRPRAAGPDAPIVFVMHGVGRDAGSYRRHWIAHAEAGSYILLVPEFGERDFADERGYQFGNVFGADGRRLPEAQWTFTAIEDLFDAVRNANGFSAPAYDLYGHSAGAQFVHRFACFKPNARLRVAVAANAGWYMLPDARVEWPYGLKGSGVDVPALRRALTRRLVILLGDADIDPAHRDLRRTPEALAQGPHRLARGRHFLERAHEAAASLGVALAWSERIAPGVGHSNARMAPHAAELVGRRD